MSDMPGHGLPHPDADLLRHTLSVHDVGRQLTDAGVPRSERQIKRYCETGFLQAVKVPGPTGDQWYVAPVSVPKLIGDLKQWAAQRAGHVQQQPATTASVPVDPPPTNVTDTAGQGRHEPASSDHDRAERGEDGRVSSAYVEQLERRIGEKDETIKFLQEELIDRRRQIGGMETIIDGQRQLLESINRNVSPVFGALAQLVQGKQGADDNIKASIITPSANDEATEQQ